MKRLFLMLVAGCLMAAPAKANQVTLTFEGLGDLQAVDNYYDGSGLGGPAGAGPAYGITWNIDALAVQEVANGGSGDIMWEPSVDHALIFLNGNADIMNVYGSYANAGTSVGFDTGFSFFYSAPDLGGTVNVYDGLNGGGNLLTSLNLTPNGTLYFAGDANGNVGCIGPHNIGTGDPSNNYYNCWRPVGVTFSGIAQSVEFQGVANFVAFDNITLGSNQAGGQVPEPASLVLLGTGLFVGYRRLRRQKA